MYAREQGANGSVSVDVERTMLLWKVQKCAGGAEAGGVGY